jgi:hypothetical protein
LPEDRDIEHAVVEDELMRIHDGVINAVLSVCLLSRVRDHVRREIDPHVMEVGATEPQ